MKLSTSLATAVCLAAAMTGAYAQQSPRQLANAATTALEKDDYAAAISGYRAALDGGYRDSTLMYYLASACVKAGKPADALAALERGVAEGMRLTDALEGDPTLEPLRGNPRWPAILQRAQANEDAYQAAHADPEKFKFVTSDIERFWTTYQQLATSSAPAQLLDQQYLDAGSIGLHGFIDHRIVSGANLYNAIGKRPKYYAAIRPLTLQTGQAEPELRAAMRKFKGMYDKATFPDVYFLIGAMNAGGTASPDGLLIGTEMLGRAPGVPTDELVGWHKTAINSFVAMPSLVTHELMHFQQKMAPQTLLGHAIKEGGADFLASLLVQGNFNERIYTYGYAHEAELKQEFFAAMKGSDMSQWLYGGANEATGRPADLGYFMGFRICQAYYQQARDKKQAIAEILNAKDFERLLADSGYQQAQQARAE